jgi:hypothetical protein
MPGTADGDFFREEYEMNYLLGISKVITVNILLLLSHLPHCYSSNHLPHRSHLCRCLKSVFGTASLWVAASGFPFTGIIV